jgi:hypothetical protein
MILQGSLSPMARDAPDVRIAFRRGKLFIGCDLLINDDPGDDLSACIGMPSLPVEVEKRLFHVFKMALSRGF